MLDHGDLSARGFVFVTGNDAVATLRDPQAPAHPKPYDRAEVVDTPARRITGRAGPAA